MKTTKTILVSAIALAATFSIVACVANPFSNKSIKGSGKLVTRTIDAPAFTGIDASRAVKVIISDKVANKITIQADDNMIDYVVVRADDGELDITIDNTINNVSNANVTVTVPANGTIRSLEASSAAQITTGVGLAASEFDISASSAAKIDAAIKARKCDIEATSASKVKAAIAATECEIKATSAAKIQLTGSANNCEAETTSAAKLDAPSFVVKNYAITSTSGSGASINCTGVLSAHATSGAGISYTGDCTTNIDRSSGGSVSKN